MKHILLLVISFVLFLTVSCERISIDTPPTDPVPLTLTRSQMEYVDNGNTFAANLLELIDKKEAGNDYFFSPLSVQMALSMLLNGTDGEAFEELCNVLGYGDDLQSVNDFCQQMIERSPTWDSKVKLSLANAMVGNDKYTFKAPYVNTLKNVFSAEVCNMDFSHKAKVLNHINNWSKDKTNGMIPIILDDIDPESTLFLMNALYFSGSWLFPFDKKTTKKSTFHCENGKTASVHMMSINETLRYSHGAGWKSVELPYGNGRAFSLHIILPEENATIHSIVEQINESGWLPIFAKGPAIVDVKLPRFETSYSEPFFKDYIKNLGANKIFKKGYFSKITDIDCYVSEVIHKAKIKVTEEGTEASASTVVDMKLTTGMSEFVSFICDRPFLYVITENTTGAIFFVGKYGGNQ